MKRRRAARSRSRSSWTAKSPAQTGVLHGGDKPQLVSVDLTGARRMILRVTDGGDGIAYDHADWAGAILTLVPGAAAKPEAYSSSRAGPADRSCPGPEPGHSWAAHRRRDTGPSVPVSCPCHRRRAA